MIDVSAYLGRIGYHGSCQPVYRTLAALQIAHLRAVPFENLDIHLGRPISLDPDALFDKIVARRRGGFCYELNGLFALLLQALGFPVTLLAARDAHEDGSLGPEFDHLTLLVETPALGPTRRGREEKGRRRLVDVGWGDTFTRPLDVNQAADQVQGRRAYRLERDGEFVMLWQRDFDGDWKRQYRFDLQPRRLHEFEATCLYHQTAPGSHFTQKRVCTRATPRGRITLSEMRLIVTKDGGRREQSVKDEAEFRALLRTHFGIAL